MFLSVFFSCLLLRTRGINMIQFWKVNKEDDFQSFGQEMGQYTTPKHPLNRPLSLHVTLKQISTIYQKALHKLAFIRDENIKQITHVGIRKKKKKKSQGLHSTRVWSMTQWNIHYHEGNNILLSKSFSLLSESNGRLKTEIPPRNVFVQLTSERQTVVIIDGSTGTKYQPEMNGGYLKCSIYRVADRRMHKHTHTHRILSERAQPPISPLEHCAVCNWKESESIRVISVRKERCRKRLQCFPLAQFFIAFIMRLPPPTHVAVGGKKKRNLSSYKQTAP